MRQPVPLETQSVAPPVASATQIRAPAPSVTGLDVELDEVDADRQCRGIVVAPELRIEQRRADRQVGRQCAFCDVAAVETLDAIVSVRGTPAYLRFDNGGEFVSAAVRDWCRFNDVQTVFIEPGS